MIIIAAAENARKERIQPSSQSLTGSLWYRGIEKKNWPFDFYIEFDLEAIEEMALCVSILILESLFWL